MAANTRYVELLGAAPANGGGPLVSLAAPQSLISGTSTHLPRIYNATKFFYPGSTVRITAAGRISCAVTTPGAARFQIVFANNGSNNVLIDTGYMPLNVVAKTTVPWRLEAIVSCRTVNPITDMKFVGQARFQSEAVVGAPLPSVGGNGSSLGGSSFIPGNTARERLVDGTTTAAGGFLDLFFAQTVGTGSILLHQITMEALN